MIAAMLKSAIVLLAAACVASFLRRQSAAVRHTIWTAGLAGAMAIPLCTLTLPPWDATFAGPALTFLDKTFGFLTVLKQVAVSIWVTGAAAGILLLIYSAGRLAWVAIGAEPVDDARWATLAEQVRQSLGIRRPVRLLQNRSVPFLGTWGILVPRVLLPRDAETWPDDRIRMVLAHELAHIQRHDWVVQVLADAARAIYWFNPIFWLASSRLRRESEHACDDAVVRLGSTGTRYAEELLAMTRALRSERRMHSPILAMAQPSHLEQRLVALLNPSLNRLAATPWAVLVVAAFAIALTLPLAAVRAGDTTLPANESPIVKPIDRGSTTQPAEAQARVSPATPLNPPAPPSAVEKTSVAASTTRRPDTTPAPTMAAEATPRADLTPGLTNSLPVAPDAVASPVLTTALATATTPPPPIFECKVTKSTLQMKTTTVEKMALGDGPWIINADRSIWVADQPYVADRIVNTVWMRPANTELAITARRLDGNAPQLTVGPAAPYRTAYIAIGVRFPSSGCWEVTATAGDSQLTFVTKVRE